MKNIEQATLRRMDRFEEVGMANIPPKRSNLHCYIGIRQQPDKSHKQISLKVRLHDTKFSQNQGTAVVSIDALNPVQIEGDLVIPTKEFRLIRKWITKDKNLKLLNDYWDGTENDTLKVLSELEPIENSLIPLFIYSA